MLTQATQKDPTHCSFKDAFRHGELEWKGTMVSSHPTNMMISWGTESMEPEPSSPASPVTGVWRQ